MESAPDVPDKLRDPQRLQALDALDLLGQPLAPSFTRIARLIAQLLHAPIALVTLVSADRQIFLGGVGLPEPWARSGETPLSHSFCQYVVADDRPLQVADARGDPLLQHNLAIRDLGVIAYLGVPLRDASGAVLGACCAIDTAPRAWTAAELATLQELAACAQTELALRAALTEQARAYAALQAADARHTATLESISDAFLTLDRDWRFTYVNSQAEQLLRHPASALLGRVCWEVFPEAITTSFGDDLHRAVAEQRPVTGEGYYPPYDIWMAMRAYPSRDGLTIIAHDITAQKRIVQALAESEQRFRQLAEQSPDYIFLVHVPQQRTIYCNRAQFLGYGPSALEHPSALLAAIDPADRPAVVAHWQQLLESWNDDMQMVEYRMQTPDGRSEWLVQRAKVSTRTPDGAPEHLLIVTSPITEQKQREAERLQLERAVETARKLESLGVMAGSIAHDFNNLLVAISGNAELALLDLDADHPAHPALQQIQLASRRAAELVDQLLTASGGRRRNVQQVDLSALTAEMMRLLRDRAPAQVALRLDPAPDLPLIDADPTQMRQVVMNLVLNAVDAIGDQPGVVTVAIRRVAFDAERRLEYALAPEPGVPCYVALVVSDTGCGMDAATQARIFEPFFTTKATGRGFGLAAVLGILRAHHGGLHIVSAVGQGTTITVLVPAAAHAGQARDEAQPPEPDAPAPIAPVGPASDGPVFGDRLPRTPYWRRQCGCSNASASAHARPRAGERVWCSRPGLPHASALS